MAVFTGSGGPTGSPLPPQPKPAMVRVPGKTPADEAMPIGEERVMDLLNDKRTEEWWTANFGDWKKWPANHSLQAKVRQGDRLHLVWRGSGKLPCTKPAPSKCLEGGCGKTCQTISGRCAAHTPAGFVIPKGKGAIIPLNDKPKATKKKTTKKATKPAKPTKRKRSRKAKQTAEEKILAAVLEPVEPVEEPNA